jgi:predicted enzyme related to lactoylglutathione lyase
VTVEAARGYAGSLGEPVYTYAIISSDAEAAAYGFEDALTTLLAMSGFALVEWGDVPIMFKSYPGVNAALSNQKVHEDVGWDAYLWVMDARRACEEIRARGGRITREIEETYYGCREFEIEDLNGLLLCFGEELSPDRQAVNE